MTDEERIRAEFAQYESETHMAAREWRGAQGSAWSARNPADTKATDESWAIRYGATKTWALCEALRDVPRDVRWLELGCSSGAHMRALTSAGFPDPLGMDLSFDALRRHGGGRVAQADALRLPLADDSVDGLTTSGTLMHLGPADRLSASVKEILRVTRRYLFLIEMWSPEPIFVSFGDLLPPAWLYPWDEALLPALGSEWEITYAHRYELLRTDGVLRSPMSVTVIARK